MITHDRPGRPAQPRRGPRRLAALGAVGVLAAGALVTTVTPAAAATETVTDATLQWGINAEVQSAAFFGGCNYLSAGTSDGTETTYQANAGDVTIVKDGGTPTWATKCNLTGGSVNQQVTWSGGTGVVDPATGEATLAFAGELSLNFYGGLAVFTIEDPVLTVDAAGNGSIVATLSGYASSIDNPNEKTPLDPVSGVVVADLSDVGNAGTAGFTVTPDYAGVVYDAPEGATPQNRTVDGWGAWPTSFVDFQQETGLSSYWYSSGGAVDPKKPPSALTVAYNLPGGGDPDPDPDPEPGEDQQAIVVTVPGEGGPDDPDNPDPGEFLWSIDAEDRTISLGETVDQGSYLQATGEIRPILVTDTRTDGPEWSISGQVSDFSGGLSGRYLGWTPTLLDAGAGAMAGEVVEPGITSGNGLSQSSTLAAAPGGHDGGSAVLGADLDLRLPVDTAPGTYAATLTITALS